MIFQIFLFFVFFVIVVSAQSTVVESCFDLPIETCFDSVSDCGTGCLVCFVFVWDFFFFEFVTIFERNVA